MNQKTSTCYLLEARRTSTPLHGWSFCFARRVLRTTEDGGPYVKQRRRFGADESAPYAIQYMFRRGGLPCPPVKGARFRRSSTSGNSNLVGNGFIRSVSGSCGRGILPPPHGGPPSFDKEGYGVARDTDFIKNKNTSLQTASGVLYYIRLCALRTRKPITRAAEYARFLGRLGSPIWVFWPILKKGGKSL